jgi:hypothetical protein
MRSTCEGACTLRTGVWREEQDPGSLTTYSQSGGGLTSSRSFSMVPPDFLIGPMSDVDIGALTCTIGRFENFVDFDCSLPRRTDVVCSVRNRQA